MATLETMNEARLAVERCLAQGAAAEDARGAELRAVLEEALEWLRTDHAALTRTAVVRQIGETQATLRAALERASAG
jgi:hypothetical protein